MSVPDRMILLLTTPLVLLVVLVSMAGLYIPDFYAKETVNWAVQSRGQDFADLFLVTPVLLCSAWFAYKGYHAGFLVWTGVLIYLVYTFLLYCFDVHFNMLFPLYTATLGLSFYALVYSVYRAFQEKMRPPHIDKRLSKVTGIYLIGLAALFYMLWLSEIVPAVLAGTVPQNVMDTGLPTNGVQVIDLAVFLPGMFIAGLLLLRQHSIGYLLAPPFLTFFVLMDFTIAGLTLSLKMQGLGGSTVVAIGMIGMAVLSLVLLMLHIRLWNVHQHATFLSPIPGR